MPLTTPAPTRRLFLASLELFTISLVSSVTNVVTVFSAPLRSAMTLRGHVASQAKPPAFTSASLKSQPSVTSATKSAAN